MKRKLKQILSVFLAVVMVGSLCTIGAYAANAEQIQADANAQRLIVDSLGKDQLNNTTVQTVSHDLTLLEKASIADLVEIDTINADGSITYAIPYESINSVEYVSIKEDSAGNTVLDITDGTRHNELILTTDGRIILDGYEIKYENSSTPIRTQTAPEITPKAGAYTRVFGTDPVLDGQGKPTKPSGYNLVASYYGPNISLGQQIASIAKTALVTIIKNAIFPHVVNVVKNCTKAVLEAALNYKKNTLAAIADQCGGASAISVGVSEYAKQGNNTIYSAWYYSVSLAMGTYSLYTAAMKVRQST